MFLTFEGLDGSGKTTIINKLVDYLIAKYPKLNLVLTREPGGKDIPEAEKIRELILNKSSNLSPQTEALLYTASRRIHLENVIWPALKAKKLVLCDRYIDSFYAYQGNARSLGMDFVKTITELVIEKTYPDLTVFFDINPKESKKRRLDSRIIFDRLDDETETFHNKVYEGYLKMIKEKPHRYLIIDATKSIGEVLDSLIQKLTNHPVFKRYIENVCE